MDPEKQSRRAPRRSSAVRHPSEHGRLPVGRREEVRRGRQARGLRFRRARRMGAAPQIEGLQGGGGLHVGDPRRHREQRLAKIYFSAGHGEADARLDRSGAAGFAQAKQLLERDNSGVGTWDSLGKGEIPADASVVVVAGPRTVLLAPEIAALQKYLAGGGRALFLLDPVLPGPTAPAADFGLGALLSAFGVKLGDDIVIDPANAVPMVGPETLIANHYGSHPIVRSLSEQGLPVRLPVARSIAKPDAQAGSPTVATMLVETSFGRVGRNGPHQARRRPEGRAGRPGAGDDRGRGRPGREGRQGREGAKRRRRVVVIGNSRFVANGTLGNAGNANLFLNAIHWLTGHERLVGIAPKTPEQASLAVSQSQVNRIGLFVVRACPSSRSCSASGSGTGAATSRPAGPPSKNERAQAAPPDRHRRRALCVHRFLRAEDADDLRAADEGRPALGPAGRPRRVDPARAARLGRGAGAGRGRVEAHAAGVLSGRLLCRLGPGAAAGAVETRRRRRLGGEGGGLRAGDALGQGHHRLEGRRRRPEEIHAHRRVRHRHPRHRHRGRARGRSDPGALRAGLRVGGGQEGRCGLPEQGRLRRNRRPTSRGSISSAGAGT